MEISPTMSPLWVWCPCAGGTAIWRLNVWRLPWPWCSFFVGVCVGCNSRRCSTWSLKHNIYLCINVKETSLGYHMAQFYGFERDREKKRGKRKINGFWKISLSLIFFPRIFTPFSSANSSAPPSFTVSRFFTFFCQFQLTPVWWTPHQGHLLTQNATLDLILSDFGQQIWHTNTTCVTSILISHQSYLSLSDGTSDTVWKSWDYEPINGILLLGQALAFCTDSKL